MDGRVSELPTEEYEYEAPAAIVLEQRGRWVRIRLSDRTVWIHASERNEFFALEDLVKDTLTTVRTNEWDGRISETPGGALVRPPGDPRRHIIGYLEPVEKQVEIVVEPGQDPEGIRRRYPDTAMGSVRGRDGRIRLLYFTEGVSVEAFERPDRAATAVMRFPNNDASELRGPGGTSPAPVFVFDRRPGWFQAAIRSDDFDDWRSERRVWIEDTSAWRFTPVQSDAERERLANGSWGPEFDAVRVVESRRVGADLWFHVEFLDHSECRGSDAPTVVRRGWIPAYSRSGEATVWFSARGC